MPDDNGKDEAKVKALEKARDQLSREWLAEEREKTRLSAAVDSLAVGFMMVDDYQKMIKKNPAVDKILGDCDSGEWTVSAIQAKIGQAYDFEGDVVRSYRERAQIGPTDVSFGSKFLRFYMSPIVVIKESLTASGTVILVENLEASKS